MTDVFFIEEHIYQKEEIPDEFIKKQYFSPYEDKYKYKLKVTGLSITTSKIYFFLPKNTSIKLSLKKKVELGKLILDPILKYRNAKKLSSEEEYWLGRKNSNAKLFDTIDWLVNDYKKYGIYVEEEIYKSSDLNDQINWNRTIKNTQPFVIDKQIIYPDLITYSKRTNHYSMLAAIHNKVIHQITQNYGWLFGVSKREKFIDVNLTIDQTIIYLERELNQTTNTRTQMLIINILTFLKKSELENEMFDVVTPYFQNVWEDAIQRVFSHNLDLQQSVGKPYWKFKNGQTRESNQFPDVLIDVKGGIVIIDAKYYSLDETMNNNLPGWSSIVKQMYYNLSIDSKYNIISNFFLIPRYSDSDNDIDYIGYASVVDHEDDFGLVHAFYLNTKLLFKSYLREVARPDLTKLLLKQVK